MSVSLDNLSETVNYDFAEMPIKTWITSYTEFPTHWHDDFEFTVMTKGKVKYSVNGKPVMLNEGECIFVNSRSIHFGEKNDGNENEFICLIIHGSLISKAAAHLVGEITDSKIPYILFSPENHQDRQIICLVRSVNNLSAKRESGYELRLMSAVYQLFDLLLQKIRKHDNAPVPDSKQLETIKRMVGFIQKNYSSKISVNDIAAAGLVCRSTCCTLFRCFLEKTPVDYLTEYRIYKSADMLRESNAEITEIGISCGFCTPSYYAEVFGRIMKCTPSEYRSSNLKG